MGISLKEIKKNRLTPAEKFVLERIEGAQPETCSDGDVIWRNQDGKRLFKQDFKNMALWVSHKYIWSVLDVEFGLNYYERLELSTNLLYEYTNKEQLKIYFI